MRYMHLTQLLYMLHRKNDIIRNQYLLSHCCNSYKFQLGKRNHMTLLKCYRKYLNHKERNLSCYHI